MGSVQEVRETIDAHRRSIDAIDAEIIRILNERAELSLAIRALKPQAGMELYDPEREERIFARLGELSEGPLRPADIRVIFEALLKVMKEIPA